MGFRVQGCRPGTKEGVLGVLGTVLGLGFRLGSQSSKGLCAHGVGLET